MEPFKKYRGTIALLDKANVDTDQMIPKQFLKSIKRTGFESNLFYDWRYLPDGKPNPDFELNQERFKNASILVTRNNFGCGSSREHAVWALAQYGFKVILAPWQDTSNSRIPAFADIFRNNATKNGILTIEMKNSEIEEIFQTVNRSKGLEATVDLEQQKLTLHLAPEVSFHFEVDPFTKEHLLRGLDEIEQTLRYEKEIAAFEKIHNSQMSRL